MLYYVADENCVSENFKEFQDQTPKKSTKTITSSTRIDDGHWLGVAISEGHLGLQIIKSLYKNSFQKRNAGRNFCFIF